MTTTTLCDCGHKPSPHESFTTGYGTDADGRTYCYDCCADRDRQAMAETGRATLYLTIPNQPARIQPPSWIYQTGITLSNWPGSLAIPIACVKVGAHNVARRRYDVWFTFNGELWHGTQYGDNTQLCHCRRIKS
jgi:hypothetical protein